MGKRAVKKQTVKIVEKKRVEKKPIGKVIPKKRPEPEPEPPKAKKVKTDDKYVRIANDAKAEEFKQIGDRVQSGELKWAYYASDMPKGYHYYIVLPIKN